MALTRQRGFKPHHANIARFLKSDTSAEIAKIGAKRIKFAAEAQTVGAGLIETGAYLRSFKIRPSADMVVTTWGPRRTYEVYNDDPAAAPIEFGNTRTRPHHILLKAAIIASHPIHARAVPRVGKLSRRTL